jgi:hypothetical protein
MGLVVEVDSFGRPQMNHFDDNAGRTAQDGVFQPGLKGHKIKTTISPLHLAKYKIDLS